MEAYRTIWSRTSGCRAMNIDREPIGMIWSHTGRYGAIQDLMELFRVIGSQTGENGAILFNIEPCRTK